MKTEEISPANLPVEQRAQAAIAAQGAMTLDELKEEMLQYSGLMDLAVTNKETDKSVHEGYMTVKALRVDLQGKGKAAREDAVALQKAVVAAEREMLAIVKPVEEKLKNNRDAYRNEQKRIREEKKRRQENIQNAISEYTNAPGKIVGLTSSEIATFIGELEKRNVIEQFAKWDGEGAEKAQEEKEKALAVMSAAHERAKAAEESQAELEKSRNLQKVSELLIAGLAAGSAAEVTNSIDALDGIPASSKEIIAAVESAAERLKSKRDELDEQEAQARKVQEAEKAQLQAERDAEAVKAKAAKEEADRLRREVAEKEAAEQARIRAEEEAKKAAEAEAAEQARQDALRPDKEKLTIFIDQLGVFVENNAPDLEQEGAKELCTWFAQQIQRLNQATKKKADEL